MANITPTSQYIEKQYNKTYPAGWENPCTDPDHPESTTIRPPITVAAMNSISNGLNSIDNYLLANAPTYVNWTVDQSGQTIVVNSAHTYVILTFGENTTYDYTVDNLFVTTPAGQQITYENGKPEFETNSVYELSFLNFDCVWKKRS